MMGSAIGIYLRNGSVHVAHLTGSPRRPRLKSIVCRHIGGDEALPEFLRRTVLRGGQVAVALPSTKVAVRSTTVPLTQASQIRQTMQFQAERLIPGISPDEIAVDWCVTEREAAATELLLFVVKKADLDAALEPLRRAQIRPRAVTADFIALFNLLAHTKQFDGAPLAAVVDFSGDALSLLLVRRGRLTSIRKLAVAEGEDLADRLWREIRRSLVAAGLSGPVDRLILCGAPPAGIAAGALEKVAAAREITTFRVPAHVKVSGGEAARRVAQGTPIPVGAALETLAKPRLAINFDRAPERFLTPYERVRRAALALALALLAFLAGEVIVTMQRSSEAAWYLDRMEKYAKALYARVVPGGKPKFSENFHKTIETVARQKAAAGTAGEEWMSFVDFMKLFTEQLPGDETTVIQSVNFRGQKATIRGEARDADSFDVLAKNLEKSGKFDVRTPFRIRSGRREGPSKLAFTIELSPRSK